MRWKQGLVPVAVAGLVVSVLTACSSSSGSSSNGGGTSSSSGGASSAGGSSSGGGSNKTITIGLETASTGPLASSFGKGTIDAAQARIDLANADHEVPGVTLKLVTADENNSPQGALQAVQNLVESKNAFALLAAGPYFFGAYRYAVQKNVPTFGIGIDGSEWSDPKNANLFSYEGSTNYEFPSYTGMPEYFKSKGVTRFCGVAYGEPAASVNPGKAMIASMKKAGIDVPYSNLSVPAGGTDFSATALAIKNAKCDGIASWMVVSSDIALFTALKNAGVASSTFKASYITGVYGQELLDDPAARAAAQGYGIGSVYQVASLNTAATQRMAAALKTYVGYDKPYPLSSHAWGWFTADLAVEALKKAAGNLTQSNVISTLRTVTDYDAGGLQCPVDFTKSANSIVQFSANCAWIATVQGDGYVSTTDPIKMSIIPGTKNG
jgi:branched-chain amino acid transport system substrate-binding protein